MDNQIVTENKGPLQSDLSLSRNNQDEEAIKTLVDFNQALELGPLYAGGSKDGTLLNKMGRYHEALIVSEKILSSNPRWTKSWMDKGYALINLGQFREALASYNKAISLDHPPQEISWNNKATALNFLGQYHESLVASEKALSFNSNLSTAWRNKGYALINLGRNQEALAVFDKVLSFDPTYSISWNDKAAALNLLGQYQEALLASEKALSLYSNLATALRNKGYALNCLGRNKESQDSYNKVLSKSKNNPPETIAPFNNVLSKNPEDIVPSPSPSGPTNLPINRKPTELICLITKNYGISIIENPAAFKGLLKDYYKGEFKKEARVLLMSLEERIPHEILSRKDQIPVNILSGQLTRRLDDCGFSNELSQWAVNTWVEALELNT